MAATTTLLDLVTPTQGSLPGVWGDTVNYGITEYLDIAIAGTLTLTGDSPVNLANTIGSSAGTNIGSTTAQYAIIKVTGTFSTTKTITAPSHSKTYLVVNASSAGTVSFIRSGQSPAVSIATNETALVYYNGTDYVKVVGTATAGAAGGSNTQVQYNNSGVLAGITGATTNGTALTLVAPVLGTPASATLTLATGLPISTGVSGLGTGIATALAVNVGTAGAFVVNGGALGSPSSVGTMPAFTLGGTVSGGGNQINNVVIGTTTPLAGAFTSLTASTTLDVTGLSTLGTDALLSLTTKGYFNSKYSAASSLWQWGPGTISTANAFGFTVGGTNVLDLLSGGIAVTGTLSATGAGSIQGLTVGLGAGAVSTNTAVGVLTLGSVAAGTTGTNSTGLGYATLSSLTSGSYNTGSGWAALNATDSGSYNTASGAGALQNNLSASNNTAVGYQAGYTNSSGQYSVMVGQGAGYSIASNTITCVGAQAGYLTTGTQNQFFGNVAGYYVTTGAKNTILGGYNGNQGGLDIRTASNYIVLSDGDGNPRGVFDSAGTFILNAAAKVSGTTYLSVQGSTASSNIFEQKDTGTSYATNNYYQVYFDSTNSVAGGIAHTTATTVAFTVSSDARLKEQIVDAPTVLQKILDTKVRSYVWKKDQHPVQYGLIAQELYEQLPEAVGKGSDTAELTDYKGTWQVEYGRLTPMLVKAIQEQQAIIESLKARLDAANL